MSVLLLYANGVQVLAPEPIPNSGGWFQDIDYPDVIVHSRGRKLGRVEGATFLTLPVRAPIAWGC